MAMPQCDEPDSSPNKMTGAKSWYPRHVESRNHLVTWFVYRERYGNETTNHQTQN